MTTPPPPEPKTLSSKILTFSAIGVGVGFGTCSLAVAFNGNYTAGGYIVWAGASVFFISLAVLILTVLYLIVAAIIRSFKR